MRESYDGLAIYARCVIPTTEGRGGLTAGSAASAGLPGARLIDIPQARQPRVRWQGRARSM